MFPTMVIVDCISETVKSSQWNVFFVRFAVVMVSFHDNKNPKTGEFGLGVRIEFLRAFEIALKYFCHFVLCFGKFSCFSDRSNLRKEGIILSHSDRYNQSIMTITTGKSRQQGSCIHWSHCNNSQEEENSMLSSLHPLYSSESIPRNVPIWIPAKIHFSYQAA